MSENFKNSSSIDFEESGKLDIQSKEQSLNDKIRKKINKNDTKDGRIINLDEIKNSGKALLNTCKTVLNNKNIDPDRKAFQISIVKELLKNYTYQGYGLGDIIMGIDINSLDAPQTSGNSILKSNVVGNSNYIIHIKDKTELASLIQAYLIFVSNKSVQFKDYQSTEKGIDGNLQRFSKQAITQFQSEWIGKRTNYENWIGNIQESNMRTVKNSSTSRNNDSIRKNLDLNNNIDGIRLLYGPNTQKGIIESYSEKATIDLSNGKLGFDLLGNEHEFPFNYPFLRDDAIGHNGNITEDLHNEIKIDDPNGPNSKTINQVITTSNVINLMINQFIKPNKADSQTPFYIGLDGNIRFSTGGQLTLDTKVINKETINKMTINYTSLNNGQKIGSKKQIVDYLNSLNEYANPPKKTIIKKTVNKDRISIIN